MNLPRYIIRSKKKFAAGFLVFFAVTLVIAGSRWSRLHDGSAVSSADTLRIYLEERTTLQELSVMLDSLGVIRSRDEVQWAGRLLGWRNFSPGHYRIDRSYSYNEFLSKLARGIQDPVSVTIVPGMTEEQILNRLTATFQFDSLALRRAVEDSSLLEQFDIERKDLIGRFLPDTYHLYWTSSPAAIVKRIFTSFRQRVAEPARERLVELDMTLNEIITLASIIAWEANYNDEKATISGVYWNRLNRGMRLQADPTVNFAVKERRRITFEDYKLDHPYNTYLYAGLPPGPITNPDLNSVEAALYPEDHDYLYMVASPNGRHLFAETFDEHKENSARWRNWLEEQYRIKKQLEAEAESEEGGMN